MKNYLIILFLSVCTKSFAHQDFSMIRHFNKVKVIIATGFYYEEINKAWIIGELASRLVTKLNYQDSIVIYLNHDYTANNISDYFISFDNGSVKYPWHTDSISKRLTSNNMILIMEINRSFNPANTLKSVEYSIRNLSSIKDNQKPLNYKKGYSQFLIMSIDTALTRKVTEQEPSPILNQILKTRVYREGSDLDDNYETSYYFENNKYYIFSRYVSVDDYKVKDSVILCIDNIYQFENMRYYGTIVFDSDNSFYFVGGGNNLITSKRHIIKNTHGFYEPYSVAELGQDKVAITFSYHIKGKFRDVERILLYSRDKDKLIQDLNKALKKQ
ncbi:MAG: hypothetical protein KGZ74_12205 [Chitinophagaceae bacterium]|nr:hypothetical protein [Chitinophagaceae bacterium]